MPVVTPDFIFGHMPKTGGTWAADYLRATTRSTFVGGSHWLLRLVPEQFWEGRGALGTFRDPWSWYGSWYLHAMSEPLARKRLSQIGGGSTAFKDVLEGLLVRKDTLPRHFGAMWVFEEGGDWREDFRVTGVGLWSWTARYVLGGHGRELVLLDTAQLRAAMGAALGREIDEKAWPRKRVGAAGRARKLWTPELVELVGAVDGDLVEVLGWAQPFAGLGALVLRFKDRGSSWLPLA